MKMEYKICKWCFEEIKDDEFVMNSDWDFIHNNCFIEFYKVYSPQVREVNLEEEIN